VESELIHSPLFTLHVNSKELLYCLLGRTTPAQTEMVGQVSPGPKIKNKRKKYFWADANRVLKYQVFSEMLKKNII
jgi:hypothetical protein